MRAVTDADRAKARRYWLDARYADDVDGPEDVIAQVIADTRAAEREAALAPVLALADELDAWRENALRHARSCPPTSTDAAKSHGRAAAYQRAIARIRAAIAAPVAQAGEGR